MDDVNITFTTHPGPGVPRHGAEEDIRSLLKFVYGDNLSPEAYEKTPRRVLRYLQEFNQPFSASEILGEMFEGPSAEGIHGLVVQSNIPFRMMCEHHLLPATGSAFLGYIPDGKVVGLSKLARLVDAVSTSKPSMQERICETIADTLNVHTKAKGVICVIDSMHTCMACRGINTPEVVSTTSCVRGVFRDVPAARSEFFSIINRNRR
jgi:GTP cyclohydrolase I